MTSPSNKDLWKKINDFTAEFELKTNAQKEKDEKKRIKEMKALLELKENETSALKKLNQNDKMEGNSTNLFVNIKGNSKKKLKRDIDPLLFELIGDINHLNEEGIVGTQEKKNLRKEEEIANEAIRDFFKKIDQQPDHQIIETKEFESLNTVKSSGELEDDGKDIMNSPMKESYRNEKSSSKLRNNDSDKLATPSIQPNVRQVFKFEIPNNEKTQIAAKFIQKRFKLFMKAKMKSKGTFY